MADRPSKQWKDVVKPSIPSTAFTKVLVQTNASTKPESVTVQEFKDKLAIAQVAMGLIPSGTQVNPTVLSPRSQPGEYVAKASAGFYNIGEATPGNDWYLLWNQTSWSLVDMGPLPDNSAKIEEAPTTATSFQKGTVKTVGRKIYRAKVNTSQVAGGTDWEVIGGGDLDIAGGALSYSKGQSIEKAIKSFLEGEMESIDVSSSKLDGTLISVANAVYTSTDPNNGAFHNLDVRNWSYLDISFVRLRTALSELKSIIGIKADNSITVLDQPSDAEVPVHLNLDISAYDYLSINYNRLKGVVPLVILSKVADPGESENPEDSVKNYIDKKVEPIESLKESRIGFNPISLNGVVPLYLASGVYSLKLDNSHVQVTAPEYSTILWKDVPTLGMGNYLKLKAIRPGGGANINTIFLGRKKSDGLYEAIGASTQANDTDILESFDINLSKYSSFSLVIGNKKATNIGLGSGLVYVDTTKPERSLSDAIFDPSRLVVAQAGVFNVDLSSGKNYHLAAANATVSIKAENTNTSDTMTLLIVPSVQVNSIIIVGSVMLWQNNEAPLLETGKAYFVTLNTFRGGATWIGSLIKAWDNSNGNII